MTLSCEEERQGVLHHLQGLVPHLQHPHHGVVLHNIGLGRLQGHLAVEPGIKIVNVELVLRLKSGRIDGRAGQRCKIQ